jgi:hypothetical protein
VDLRDWRQRRIQSNRQNKGSGIVPGSFALTQFAWLSAAGSPGLRTLGLRESAARFETEAEARAAIQSHIESENCRDISFEIMAAE